VIGRFNGTTCLSRTSSRLSWKSGRRELGAGAEAKARRQEMREATESELASSLKRGPVSVAEAPVWDDATNDQHAIARSWPDIPVRRSVSRHSGAARARSSRGSAQAFAQSRKPHVPEHARWQSLRALQTIDNGPIGTLKTAKNVTVACHPPCGTTGHPRPGLSFGDDLRRLIDNDKDASDAAHSSRRILARSLVNCLVIMMLVFLPFVY
jgi:hypothetical protein